MKEILMKKMIKLALVVITFACSQQVFALMNRLDVLGYGGYSQADTFSDSTFKSDLSSMKGIDAGGMILVTLSSRRLAPVIGAGAEYMQVKSTVADSTNTNQFANTLTTQAATGHLGVRASSLFARFFLLGNYGYGLSGTLIKDKTLVSDGTAVSTTNYTIKNHTYYGGTLALFLTFARFLKFGVSGIYNMHTLSAENDATLVKTDTTYQEVSANLVLDISL